MTQCDLRGYALSMVDLSQDDVVFPSYTQALRVGGGGTLVVEPEWGDTTITFDNVVDGEILTLSIKRIFVEGTTCKNIVAFFTPPEPIIVTLGNTDVTYGDQDISYQTPRNV